MPPERRAAEDLERTARLLWEARDRLAYGNLDSVLQRPWMPADAAAASGAEPFPHFVESARGCEFVDTLGRTFVDWVGGGGTVLLGHRHPGVETAVLEQLARGSSLSLMHPFEVELARTLCEIVPCAERVAFGKNGSDALTAALRVARAATGREIVLHYGMHGFHDWFVAGNPLVRGAPAGLAERLHPFPYNDLPALEALFERHHGAVAAVVMEPVREILPRPGYMQAVADLTRRNGALLVFDEVVTALRLGPGGGQAYVGVEPDLACLGKALANGLPLSALVGPRREMELVPSIAFGMTFRGEALALAAARVVLRTVRDEPVGERLAEIGAAIRARYHAAAARHAVRSRLAGPPARMTFTFEPQGGRTPAELQTLFVQEMLRRGVFTNGNLLPTYAHDDSAIARTASAFDGALEVLARSTGARAPRPDEPASPPLAATATGFVESVSCANGRTRISGWMLLDDGPPDAVDLRTADGSCLPGRILERADVASTHPGMERALHSGFTLELPDPLRGAALLRAWRGDRVAFVCRILFEGEGLASPHWIGDGLLYV